RRFAPRPDDHSSVRAGGTVPSEAIQGEGLPRLDCFVASLLAMTVFPSLRAGGTLPSEAIQGEGLPRLDCFVASLLAMTVFLSLRASPLVHPPWIGGVAGAPYSPQHPVSDFRAGVRQMLRSCFYFASIRGR
ncbi:MAG: hypothetical protein LBT00_00640, partial [Spirochaetaceae bacterium]|nr:hypothetical protein [Spirochaetaceae bacterium]